MLHKACSLSSMLTVTVLVVMLPALAAESVASNDSMASTVASSLRVTLTVLLISLAANVSV